MICKYCGQELPDNSKFCIFCGNIIKHPEDMEIPVRVMHTTPTDNQFEEYKPKHNSQLETEEFIEIPEIEDTSEIENVPEIEIINIEKEKKPMQHNEEKLKMLQNLDTSSNVIVEPDKEELLETITNKQDKPLTVDNSASIENDILNTENVEQLSDTVEETQVNNKKEKNSKLKKPEVVYLGNKFNFSNNKEHKVLNGLIIAFAILAIALALKTFVF